MMGSATYSSRLTDKLNQLWINNANALTHAVPLAALFCMKVCSRPGNVIRRCGRAAARR